MSEEIDWRVVTFAGNRRRQREEFHALPLREKLIAIEQLSMVTEYFLARRAARTVRLRVPPQLGMVAAAPDPPVTPSAQRCGRPSAV